jgi:predicted RNA-binding protein
MKKLLSVGFALVLATQLFAQINNDEMQMYQTLFGMAKKEIVGEFVKIDGPKNDTFWKLYDDYENNRKQLGQKRFVALNNYVKNYTKLSAAETDEIMEDIILLTTSQDKLIARYYGKIKKAIGINVAAQFYQIEWYLQSQIRTNILENIPTINDLEKKN